MALGNTALLPPPPALTAGGGAPVIPLPQHAPRSDVWPGAGRRALTSIATQRAKVRALRDAHLDRPSKCHLSPALAARASKRPAHAAATVPAYSAPLHPQP